MHPLARLALAAGCTTTLLAGCSDLQNVRIRDHDSPAASVRVTVRPDFLARNASSQGGIELAYDRYRARDTQDLLAGQSVTVGSGLQTVQGPDTLRNEATVEEGHVAYTHRFSHGAHFQVEPLLGVSRLRMKVGVEPAVSAQRLRVDHGSTHFFYGVTPRWRFNELVAVELRLQGSHGDEVRGYSTDLGVLLNPVPQVGLRIGYSERRHYGTLNDSLSDMDIRVRGPSATLLLDF
jgi:hypothetical protein